MEVNGPESHLVGAFGPNKKFQIATENEFEKDTKQKSPVLALKTPKRLSLPISSARCRRSCAMKLSEIGDEI